MLPENCRLWASQLDILCRPHRVVVASRESTKVDEAHEARPAGKSNPIHMYSPKIDENQIQRLYRLRESMKENGTKTTMAAMAREAIEQYLTEKETNEKKHKGRHFNSLIEDTDNI